MTKDKTTIQNKPYRGSRFKPTPTVADLRIWSIKFSHSGYGIHRSTQNRTFEIAAPDIQSAINGFWAYMDSLEGDDAYGEVKVWAVNHHGAVNLIVSGYEGEE